MPAVDSPTTRTNGRVRTASSISSLRSRRTNGGTRAPGTSVSPVGAAGWTPASSGSVTSRTLGILPRPSTSSSSRNAEERRVFSSTIRCPRWERAAPTVAATATSAPPTAPGSSRAVSQETDDTPAATPTSSHQPPLCIPHRPDARMEFMRALPQGTVHGESDR
ncbi:hypothetical protein [Streptomyces sviceus]|uniref:hypothetical protein n=1 Tax=Streptomyces sviceus TaxID=285530 RepID=UPI0036E698BB